MKSNSNSGKQPEVQDRTTNEPQIIPLRACRTPIRDRKHAAEIASQIDFGDLLNQGGSRGGFADWLFVNRKSFNGANVLQQPSVYVSGLRSAAKRGVDFDVECRIKADETEQRQAQADAAIQARIAIIEAWWDDTPVGPDISVALAALNFGRGHRFAVSPNPDSLDEPTPAWVLEALLNLFEQFGGPSDSLHKYSWMATEEDFQYQANKLDPAMRSIWKLVHSGQRPTPFGLVALAWAARNLSCMARVRHTLKTLLIQAEMVELIEQNQRVQVDVVDKSKPTRRKRLV